MTLYDLLGALPNDDAEGLRAAFRRAVKGAHPDIHPGDPGAALKFREIVRASEILCDQEQRAAYDHLLDLAHLEEASASGQATAARVHKLASGVIALAGVLVVTVGGYLLLTHMTAASVAPADKMAPATHASAYRSPAPPPVTIGKGASVVKDASVGIAGEAIEPGATTSRANAENIPAANIGPTPDPTTGDAKPSRARSTSADRDVNLNGAVADLRQASLLDPKISPATIGRGGVFNHLRKFDRAFADIAPMKQKEPPGRTISASATSGTPHFGPAKIARPATPVPRRRSSAQDPSREESVVTVRVR
jgi:DnaJ domain